MSSKASGSWLAAVNDRYNNCSDVSMSLGVAEPDAPCVYGPIDRDAFAICPESILPRSTGENPPTPDVPTRFVISDKLRYSASGTLASPPFPPGEDDLIILEIRRLQPDGDPV